ncbi:anthranilate synthase component I family protein [Natronomonas marina]|uniref:anthranilate synthase component I family protein n=1 Tax=Natronomonas marina TaxID=2961939 RepID=UPI0020C9F097|nr:anthranilate synthase component I family protein [Natronomonas marina]
MRVVTDRAAFRETAADAPPEARVPVELRVRVADPFEAYRRARRGDGNDVFLETTGGQSGWGYFATDAVERVTVSADAASIDGGSPSVDALANALDGEALRRGDCDVPYPCGLFGWLSYDVARELESLPETTDDDRELPRLQLAKYDRVAAWEEPWTAEATLRVTACPRLCDHASVDAAYEWAVGHARNLVARAVAGDRSVGRGATASGRATFTAGTSREVFTDRVRTVKEYVRDGDTFQANVSQRLSAPATVHPVEAYAALRRVNPAPYSALVEFPGVDLVSASPELLLDVEGDRLLTEPIAGTRPRGETPEADDDLETDLLADEKERAEHAMLVDLERNDLGKVSEFGSVDVPEYRRVDRYSEVMHLVSLVEGRRREDCSVADAVAAVFPGGTITGAPKPRTMEIIDEVETTRRGPYTGSVGVFGFDDRATLNIVIRTLVRHGGTYYLRVGAGVVHDSNPDDEFEETLDKGRALVTAIDAALEEHSAFTLEAVER